MTAYHERIQIAHVTYPSEIFVSIISDVNICYFKFESTPYFQKILVQMSWVHVTSFYNTVIILRAKLKDFINDNASCERDVWANMA